MQKQILAIALAIVSVIAVASVAAETSDGAVGDTFQIEVTESVQIDGDYPTYKLGFEITSDNTVSLVLKFGSTPYITEKAQARNLVIPETVEHDGTTYTVTEIGRSVFASTPNLITVTIPDSVTTIDSYAFYDSGLGQGSETSGWKLEIPDSVTTIGYGVFQGTNVTSATLSKNLSSVGQGLFDGCESLASVTIPEGVTDLGYSTFRGCTALKEVELPSTITEIPKEMFWKCESLTTVNIPDTVTSIGSSAFGGTAITSVTIPDTVTSIGDSAFENCESLTTVKMSGNVTQFGSEVFTGCDAITSVETGEGNGIHIQDGVIYTPDWTAVSGAYASLLTGAITIDGRVTSIATAAFKDCTSVTSVTLPDGLTQIGNEAFYNCTSLTSVTIPDTVTSIGTEAFNRCSALTSIDIPDSVTTVGYSTFYGCTALETVGIGASVSEISGSSFNNCTSISAFNVDGSNPWFDSVEGVLYTEGQVEILKYPSARTDTTFEVPSGTVILEPSAFNGSAVKAFTVADGNTAFAAVDGVLYNIDVTEIICCPLDRNSVYVVPETVKLFSVSIPARTIIFTSMTAPTYTGDPPPAVSRAHIFAPEGSTGYDELAFPYGDQSAYIWTLPTLTLSESGGTITASLTTPPQTDLIWGTPMYEWSDYSTGTSISPIDPGVYSVEVSIPVSFSNVGNYPASTTVPLTAEYTYSPSGPDTIEVTFTPEGGTGTVLNITSGETIDTNMVPSPGSKTGYTFEGWALQGTTEATDLATYTVESAVTFVPLWALNAPTVTIIVSNSAPTEGETVMLTANATHSVAIEFRYKWTDASSSTTQQIGVTASGTYTVTVYAVCNGEESIGTSGSVTLNFSEPAPTDHTITFYVDGNLVDTKTVADGRTLTDIPTDPTKTGYNFDGWKINGVDAVFTNVTSDFSVNAAFTLKAPSKVTVELSGPLYEGGSITATVTAEHELEGVTFLYAIMWSDGTMPQFGESPTFTIDHAGEYAFAVGATYDGDYSGDVAISEIEVTYSAQPAPGYDDDEDLPPFVPSQTQGSDDDSVTIVACAAAAVVAALMAVFLIVSYRKD